MLRHTQTERGLRVQGIFKAIRCCNRQFRGFCVVTIFNL